jgi:hypothetical protein
VFCYNKEHIKGNMKLSHSWISENREDDGEHQFLYTGKIPKKDVAKEFKPFSETLKNVPRGYQDYRCIEPRATETTSPWFPRTNICPCDPSYSNPTGRSFSGCPFGIDPKDTRAENSETINNGLVKGSMVGAEFPMTEGVPVASVPQFTPRPYALIGYQWRSANA